MIQEMTFLMFPIVFFILFIGLLALILWIGALVSFLGTENMGEDRVVWAIIIVFAGIIGAILWFAIGRPKSLKPLYY